MQATVPHRWDLTPPEAARLQLEMRGRLKKEKDFGALRTVAGSDIALSRRGREAMGYAGVIVYSFPDLKEIERHAAERPLTFPYVPGLLVFREGPALVDAFARLRTEPDLLLFDAHGYSHPRRLGLACHLSVVMDKPGIGVAKSLLVGDYREPPDRFGAWTPLVEGEETIGAVLRSEEH